MKWWLAIAFLAGMLLCSFYARGYDEQRPCVVGVIGEQPAAYIRQYFPDTQKGDLIIARRCWTDS
jgi:hypothetical protein